MKLNEKEVVESENPKEEEQKTNSKKYAFLGKLLSTNSYLNSEWSYAKVNLQD